MSQKVSSWRFYIIYLRSFFSASDSAIINVPGIGLSKDICWFYKLLVLCSLLYETWRKFPVRSSALMYIAFYSSFWYQWKCFSSLCAYAWKSCEHIISACALCTTGDSKLSVDFTTHFYLFMILMKLLKSRFVLYTTKEQWNIPFKSWLLQSLLHAQT